MWSKGVMIIENSIAARVISRLVSGSLVFRLLARFIRMLDKTWVWLLEMTERILQGSRLISVFKVGDYIDQDSGNLFEVIESAGIYRWISKYYTIAVDKWGKIDFPGKLGKSRFVSCMIEFRRDREKVLSNRNILAFLLVFLAAFYSIRFLLLIICPVASSYIPWTSGVLLFVVLTLFLVQLRTAAKKPDSVGDPDDFQHLERLFSRTGDKIARSFTRLMHRENLKSMKKGREALRDLADRAGLVFSGIFLLIKYFKTFALKLISRGTPPVEGGSDGRKRV